MRIATLGDVLLDVVVLLSEPLASGGDVRASNRAGAGGQAANVAAWAAELGAEARCIAKRGDDPAERGGLEHGVGIHHHDHLVA